MSPREEQLRRRALLTPTALRWVDPDGEDQRVRALDAAFDFGPAPSVSEQARLDRASDDADDALLGGMTVDPPAWRSRGERLRHPLSGGSLATPDRSEALTAWETWFDRAVESVFSAGSASVQALWWAVADDGCPAGEPSPLALADSHNSPWLRLPGHPALPDVPAWARRSLTLALFAARSPVHGGEAALVQLHIGPVKRFIEAARRTHDLWLGSYLLAHLSCRMVETVAEMAGSAAVIYPFVGRLPLIRRALRHETLTGDDRLALLRAVNPNKVLALVPAGDADRIASAAAQAANAAWAAFGRQVFDELGRAGTSTAEAWSHVERAHFDSQMAGHLEFGAWIQPWPADRAALVQVLTSTGAEIDTVAPQLPGQSETRIGASYGLLFNAIHRALGAARQTDAPQYEKGDHRPKCTQCGVREQLGPLDTECPARQTATSKRFWRTLSAQYQERKGPDGEGRYALQLRHGEGLCAVCFTKRMAPEHLLGLGPSSPARLDIKWARHRALLRFPSVASIASAPYRRRLLKVEPSPAGLSSWIDQVVDLEERLLEFTPPGNQLIGLGRLGRPGERRNALDVDGTWLYRSAYDPAQLARDYFDEPARQKSCLDDARFEPAVSRARVGYREIEKALRRSHPDTSPSKYFAVVKMDGDDFGQWITGRAEQRPTLAEVTPTWLHDVAESQLESADAAKDKEAQAYWSRWLGRTTEPALARPLSPALHGELSRRLAVAGTSVVPDVIERFGLGRIIYSGGDDMLAVLPLETVLPSIDRLIERLRHPTALHDRVTFSGGIAIGHMRAPLSRSVERAGRGEDQAKLARKRFVRLAREALVTLDAEVTRQEKAGRAVKTTDLEKRARLRALFDDLRSTGWLHVELHPSSGDPLTVLVPHWLPRADQHQDVGDRLNVLQLIGRLLNTRDRRGQRVFSTSPAHRLAEEGAALAGHPEALIARLRSIAGRSRAGAAASASDATSLVGDLARLIRGLAELMELNPVTQDERTESPRTSDPAAPHNAVVGLLLVARFLERELPPDSGVFISGLEAEFASTPRPVPEEADR